MKWLWHIQLQLYSCIKKSPWGWQDCWSKHVGEDITNKIYHDIKVHKLIVYTFYKSNECKKYGT